MLFLLTSLLQDDDAETAKQYTDCRHVQPSPNQCLQAGRTHMWPTMVCIPVLDEAPMSVGQDMASGWLAADERDSL